MLLLLLLLSIIPFKAVFETVKEIVAELLWPFYMLSMIQTKSNLKSLLELINVSLFTSSKEGTKIQRKDEKKGKCTWYSFSESP